MNINVQDNNGDTPLHLAIRNSRIECVALLLKQQNIDVLIKNKKDEIAIAPALSSTTPTATRILDLFIENNRKVFPASNQVVTQEEKDNNEINKKDSGSTQLLKAADNGDITTLISLLNNPYVDVNSGDNRPSSPLHRASYNENPQYVRLLLLHRDINVNIPDEGNWRPLHWSVQGGHVDCIKLLLLSKGIDINIRNNLGKTPLTIAEEQCPSATKQEVLNILKEHGATK